MLLDKVQKFASPEEALAHISEKPWSDYTKADYSVEQWHAACLIHIHDGAPTSKSQCKLPVKTPNGALNRNGVHAAAAALAGARGGLKGVSADQRKTAGNALKRYYAQLDEDAPESLIEHAGVKGMKWGVRKAEEAGGSSKGIAEKSPGKKGLTDAEKAARLAKAKKVAIGVGILTAAAGAGFVAYKLNQSGALPLSTLKKTAPAVQTKAKTQVKKTLAEPTSIIHASRGKNKGFSFYKKGDTADFFKHWEETFSTSGGGASSGMFKRLEDGKVAASFLDPGGRKDFSGRPIPHEVIVPKSMAGTLHSVEDVIQQVWPKLQDTYIYD